MRVWSCDTRALCEPGADVGIPEFTCLCVHTQRLHSRKSLLTWSVCLLVNMHTHICEHLQVRAHTEDSVT